MVSCDPKTALQFLGHVLWVASEKKTEEFPVKKIKAYFSIEREKETNKNYEKVQLSWISVEQDKK